VFVPQFVYTTEKTALAYLEVYRRIAEVRQPEIAVELKRQGSSEALARVPAIVTPTKDADRWVATAALRIGDLSQGEYMVEGLAFQGSKIVGAVRRILVKGESIK